MHGLLPGGERPAAGVPRGEVTFLAFPTAGAGARAQRAEPEDGTGTLGPRRPGAGGGVGEAGTGRLARDGRTLRASGQKVTPRPSGRPSALQMWIPRLPQ